MANSFWIAPGMTPASDFANVLGEYYRGEVVNQDPSGTTGQRKINDWVKSKTNGLIPEMLQNPLNSNYALVNTVYFKGAWTQPFKPQDTRRESFYNFDGTIATPYFMQGSKSDVDYADTDKFGMVTLPFNNGKFRMSFIMAFDPDSDETLTAEEWNLLHANTRKRYLGIEIPKFEFSYGKDLFGVLDAVSQGRLSSVEFSRFLAGGTPLPIKEILHSTRIAVDEKGCEAAAATYSGSVGSFLPESIRFDHPFYFVIHEDTTDAILFIGLIKAF